LWITPKIFAEFFPCKLFGKKYCCGPKQVAVGTAGQTEGKRNTVKQQLIDFLSAKKQRRLPPHVQIKE